MTASGDAAAIRLAAEDNVVTARDAIAAGRTVAGEGVAAAEPIPAGHKLATRAIAAGEAVRKYGQVIGFAAADIAPGAHVHTHNVAVRAFDRDPAVGSAARDTDFVAEGERATFQGYRRGDGRVGTRNYIGVLTSVNCSASVARFIAEAVARQVADDFPGVDGVVAFPHHTGCGMAGSGDGWDNFQRVLWGYARHPNLAGVVLVGLGCEGAQIRFLTDAYGLAESERFRTLVIQDAGGTRATVDRGVALVREMLPAAAAARRQTCSAADLVLALQCGGSDAYSGITANPALGEAVNLLVRHGGTAILSETPEIYGAEHLLTRRAASPGVAEKLLARIAWWEDYTARNGAELNNNPSPGNKAGGLTTILEKSLGAAAKGGTTNLNGVYRYGEPVDARGLVFMDSPGYDPCSITGQVASGATAVCFTTGRGSVYGCKPAPSLKLATNTPMYDRMTDDMDVNCGRILDGEATVAAMGAEIFDRVLDLASGTPSRSERHGLGDLEFLPWQIGAVI
ncbi:MAG: altronate dehydratase [Hyphomicrobiales bacterium]|nr:altronate dehydratase [Hyphomicrobiales bacterium]